MSLTEIFPKLRALDKSTDSADRARHGELRDQIALASLPLVKNVAAAYVRQAQYLNASNDTDDLVSEGVIGLLCAIDRFDPEQGVTFNRFAAPYILGYMQKYVGKRFGLTRESCGEPTFESLVEAADSGAEPLADHAERSEKRAEMRDAITDAVAAVEAGLKTERSKLAWSRSRKALEMRFFEGMTPDEIGVEFCCSKAGACNLIARGLELLKPHLSEKFALESR